MQIQEKRLRNIINQEIKKLAGVNETDLVASDKSSWDTKKAEFKNLVTNLLQNIETDDYDDASGEITQTMGILKTWKSRIDKGLMDSTKINEMEDESYWGKKDLEQLQRDSNDARNHPDTIRMAGELANSAISIDDLLAKSSQIFKSNNIVDSEVVQHVIDLAVTQFKQKNQI